MAKNTRKLNKTDSVPPPIPMDVKPAEEETPAEETPKPPAKPKPPKLTKEERLELEKELRGNQDKILELAAEPEGPGSKKLDDLYRVKRGIEERLRYDR
jgi:hypothetical protein